MQIFWPADFLLFPRLFQTTTDKNDKQPKKKQKRGITKIAQKLVHVHGINFLRDSVAPKIVVANRLL